MPSLFLCPIFPVRETAVPPNAPCLFGSDAIENIQVISINTVKIRYFASDGRRCFVHLSCARCPFLAVVLVNSAPHLGQYDFADVPDFSLWCRSKLLNVENWRPLHPCSQHWGLGRWLSTRIDESPMGCFAITSFTAPPLPYGGGYDMFWLVGYSCVAPGAVVYDCP